MKKTVFLSLLLVAGLASCNRTQEAEGPEPAATQPSAEQAQIFHATLEGAESKVYTDEALHVLWNADDRVSIFDKYTRNKQFRFKGIDGATGGDFEEVSSGGFGTGSDLDYNYAVYPYNENTGYYFDEILWTEFPKNQTYRASSFGPGANLMVAKSPTNDLSFKNVGGYLCLKLYGEGISVRSIVLTGNGEETLSGPVKITFGSENIPAMAFDTTMPDQLEKEIVLTPASPVALPSSEADALVFWMVVPTVTLPGGFTVTVIDDKGGLHTKSTTKSFTFERNQRTSMKAFELKESEVPAPLTIGEMGAHPVAGTGYIYDKTQDQVNLYEQEGKVWARFLRIPTLRMYEIGPIPADVTAGTTITTNVDVYENGVKVAGESSENCKLTVQSIAGGIINLVSDEGTRYAIRF